MPESKVDQPRVVRDDGLDVEGGNYVKPEKAPEHPYKEEEPRPGTFVDVVAGEYEGLYGAYIKPEGDKHAVVRSRDHGHHSFPEYVSVLVKDLRPSTRTGGR